MKRFSLAWWLAILPTSILVGGGSFVLLEQVVAWSVQERIIAAALCAFAADLAIAAWIQSGAPTRIIFGPGERSGVAEPEPEIATVIAGFEGEPYGRVRVRGESWPALGLHDDTNDLSAGVTVRVVDRVGLHLVVCAV